MPVKIPVSDARKRLSDLLKNITRDPDLVYEITVNDIVLGELRSSSAERLRVETGGALLKALEEVANNRSVRRGKRRIAREHDRYLYPSRRSRGSNSA